MPQYTNKVRLRIEKIVAGGDGLGRWDGRAVFVPLVAAGELVDVEIEDTRRDFARGRLISVVEPAAGRNEPPCPVYGICGGCNFQHIEYSAQLQEKINIVVDAFRRVARYELERVSIVPGRPLGYRSRVQLHRAADGSIGYRRLRSHDIVAVKTCPIADPAINAFLASNGLPDDRERAISRFGVIGGPEGVHIEGRDGAFTLDVSGRRIAVDPAAFFQSNLEMLGRLIPYLCLDLPAGRAADLYAGVGIFSVHLAERFDRVVAVEAARESALLAKENLSAYHNAEVVDRSVEEWIHTGSAGRFDLVVVDPPRTGLSREVRAYLKETRPGELRYVSCDPVSLARDAGELIRDGFSLEDCVIFDFYPQTSHVESLVRLRRTGRNDRRVGDSPGNPAAGPHDHPARESDGIPG